MYTQFCFHLRVLIEFVQIDFPGYFELRHPPQGVHHDHVYYMYMYILFFRKEPRTSTSFVNRNL